MTALHDLSAEALATVGVTPGATVDGYTWPDAAAGKPDAVTTAGQWIVPGIISTGQVTINTAATSCNGAAGSFGPFVTVAIVSSYWGANVLPPPFAATTVHVASCFPI